MMGIGAALIFFAVDPDYARTGYGKILMAEPERFLLSVGCPKINFCVRTDNAKVTKFYQQFGYAIEPVHFIGKCLIKDD